MTPSERWNRSRNLWLLAALAAPLVACPWAFDAAELPKLTFLRLVALGLTLTGLFSVSRSAWASADEKQVSEIHPLRLPVMLYLIVMGAAAFGSPDPWSSLAATLDLAMLAFFAFSFTGAARDASFQSRAIGMMAAVGGLCAGWGLLQLGGTDPLNGAALRHAGGVPVGPFADPRLLAGFLAASMPLAAGAALRGGSGRWAWGSFLLIAAMLGITRQPLPILAGWAGTALALALVPRSLAPFRRWNLAALGLAVVLTGLAGGVGGRAPSGDRLSDAALRGAAWNAFREKPLLGWGPGAFGLIAPHFAPADLGEIPEPNRPPATTPEHFPLTILVSGGGLAFLSFLWILGGAAVLLAKRLRNPDGQRNPDGNGIGETDAGLAALWAGFLAAWLLQGWTAPGSIALWAPFWCALGMASTSIRWASKFSTEASCKPWPAALRWAGGAAVVALVVPLPRPSSVTGMRQGLKPSLSLGSELVPGPGAAVRWMIGDLYYNAAVKARERKDWDAALGAHLASLVWAPSRLDNWRGYGDTALAAAVAQKDRPVYWLQYGRMGYYRAQRLQPLNGYLYYGEGRLLTEAVRRGGDQFYPDAKVNFERALALCPNAARIHADYGRLLELKGETAKATEHYRRAASLTGPIGNTGGSPPRGSAGRAAPEGSGMTVGGNVPSMKARIEEDREGRG